VADGTRLIGMSTFRQVTGALAAGGLALGLAACGSATSGAGGSGLCGQAGRVTRLVVEHVRPGPLPARKHSRFALPAETVTDPAAARSIAEAACALPVMPSGAISCPMDSGVMYRLLFSVGGTKLPPVSVDPTGCGDVSGLGQARTTARSPRFVGSLHEVMGKIPVG
jgi:hypothetical protein